VKLRIAICWLSLVGVGACACPVLEVARLKQSSQRITVRVERQGNPVQGAKVSVLGQPIALPGLTVLTDTAGLARLPQLKNGIYSIQAEFEAGIAGESINVKHARFAKPTQFNLVLVHSPSKAELAVAQSKPTSVSLRIFSGTITDLSGARIPEASVQVFKRGETDEWNGINLRADQNGRFKVDLPQGTYVAFVRSPGFAYEIISFEIDPESVDVALPLALRLGVYVC